jgi:hypothetical protein
VEVEQWMDLPLPPIKRAAHRGVPIVIPAEGKRVLAQIVWSNNQNRIARFIKAGRRSPHALSRKEYLELATAETSSMTSDIVDGLLAAWAIRAVKERDPELARRDARILQVYFAAQLVELLLGYDPKGGKPVDVVCRYLLSQNYRRAIELVGLEDRLRVRHLEGTLTNEKSAALDRAKIRAVGKKIKEKYALQIRSQSGLVEQIRLEPEVFNKKGKPPSRSKILRALNES